MLPIEAGTSPALPQGAAKRLFARALKLQAPPTRSFGRRLPSPGGCITSCAKLHAQRLRIEADAGQAPPKRAVRMFPVKHPRNTPCEPGCAKGPGGASGGRPHKKRPAEAGQKAEVPAPPLTRGGPGPQKSSDGKNPARSLFPKGGFRSSAGRAAILRPTGVPMRHSPGPKTGEPPRPEKKRFEKLALVLVLAGGLNDQKGCDGCEQPGEEKRKIHDPPLVRRQTRRFRSCAPATALA